MTEKKVLFLCTGNYYRSRFAEELFNHLAREKGLNWRATSRGLAQGFELLGNPGHISAYTLRELEKRSVKLSPKRAPQRLERNEGYEYQIVIALDKDEHRPLIESFYPEIRQVIYWDIKDLGDEAAEKALGRIATNINGLIADLTQKA